MAKKPRDEDIEEQEAPEEAAAPEEVPDEGAEKKQPAGEPGTPPPGSSPTTYTVKLEGEGMVTIEVDRVPHEISRGVETVVMPDVYKALVDQGYVKEEKAKDEKTDSN